jgi:hypothetical protein
MSCTTVWKRTSDQFQGQISKDINFNAVSHFYVAFYHFMTEELQYQVIQVSASVLTLISIALNMKLKTCFTFKPNPITQKSLFIE